jgi:NADH dehydrogenase (ubiquinone) 1 beta subcomplex subunit 8
MGALSLHDYDHFTPGWGAVLMGGFIVSVLGLCGVVSLYYPDKISVPKTYEGGLEAELGGPRAVRVSSILLSLQR